MEDAPLMKSNNRHIPEDTVDGRHPKQPPAMYETMKITGYLPYQPVQEFFHQQYVRVILYVVLS